MLVILFLIFLVVFVRVKEFFVIFIGSFGIFVKEVWDKFNKSWCIFFIYFREFEGIIRLLVFFWIFLVLLVSGRVFLVIFFGSNGWFEIEVWVILSNNWWIFFI